MKETCSAPIRSNPPSLRRYWVVAVLFLAALVSLLPAILPDAFSAGGLGYVSAQISPFSPLQTVDSGGPIISVSGPTLVNVMASGQASLTRLALLLITIVIGAGVIVWRQP